MRGHNIYLELESKLATNSSIEDWVSDCQTPVNITLAGAEPVGAGYFRSSASRHFTRILPWCQELAGRSGGRAYPEAVRLLPEAVEPLPEAVLLRMSASVVSTVFQKESDGSL